jgi:hypothetical protein
VVFKIRGTKFPKIASRYGEWQLKENFRVLSTRVKENLYWSGLERSGNLRAFWPWKTQRPLGQLFDFFKCFVNCAYISNCLFVLLKTMVISSKNCHDNRHGSVVVSNNFPILLYTIYYVDVGFHFWNWRRQGMLHNPIY